MLGDKVGAEEAEQMGMIYKAYGEESFEAEVERLLIKLSNMPTKGLALTKKAFNQSMTNKLEEQLEVESRLQIEASQTHDYTEGVSAFIEKRKPSFKGK